MFGATFTADDAIIRPLEASGIRRLYPYQSDHRVPLQCSHLCDEVHFRHQHRCDQRGIFDKKFCFEKQLKSCYDTCMEAPITIPGAAASTHTTPARANGHYKISLPEKHKVSHIRPIPLHKACCDSATSKALWNNRTVRDKIFENIIATKNRLQISKNALQKCFVVVDHEQKDCSMAITTLLLDGWSTHWLFQSRLQHAAFIVMRDPTKCIVKSLPSSHLQRSCWKKVG